MTRFYAAVGGRLVRHRLRADGEVESLETVDLQLDVQYACLDPEETMLYCICSNGGVGRDGDRHFLAVLSIGDGAMREEGARIALPHRPIHIALDRGADRLLIAYNRPAALTVHPLGRDGAVRGTLGPFDGEPLVGHFPHQVLPLPARHAVLLVCRGDDATPTRGENPGSLRVLALTGGEARCVRSVAPHGGFGFGPRNCAIHPNGAWLYAVLERQNALAMFRLDEDAIEPGPAFALCMLERPERILRPQLAGAVLLHPDGRCGYALNRSHAGHVADGRLVDAGGENSVVVFDIDPVTGAPSVRQVVALPGVHARCFCLVDDGRSLVVGMRQPSAVERAEGGLLERSAGFSVFRVDRDGGIALSRHHAVEVGAAQLFWVGACGSR